MDGLPVPHNRLPAQALAAREGSLRLGPASGDGLGEELLEEGEGPVVRGLVGEGIRRGEDRAHPVAPAQVLPGLRVGDRGGAGEEAETEGAGEGSQDRSVKRFHWCIIYC